MRRAVYLRPEDRARPNRMALRIAVVGGVGVALFAILFFRLWSLQIIEGSENLAQAKNNRTRSTKIVPPRGKILTRNGEVMVDNRTSLALQVDAAKLPAETAAKNAELKELGELVHMKLPQVQKRLEEEEKVVAAGAPLTVRHDVGYNLVYYIEEHPGKFPGATVEKVFVRNYPDEDEAAQVLGHTGEVSEEELKAGPYKGLEPGEVVGKEGIEYSYDKYLRGTPGISRYQVNALGEPTPGGKLTSTPPKPGDNLKLTINPAVQRAGEQALAERGPGAFVSMNIHTGEILGIGSYPTYDPTVWTKTMSEKEYHELAGEEGDGPLFNRAVEAAWPTGSTYKIMTALAGLENGYITGSTVVDDNGYIELGTQKFENSEGEVNGPITLTHAFEVSSDVYFYKLGARMWDNEDLQDWSHKMGIGDPTGIDIPTGGSAEGLVPNRKWRDQLFEEKLTERPWSQGDDVQLAVGQGDLVTNPLQMAIAYATLGNGGTVVTPHLGKEVTDAAGRVLKEIDPGPRRHVTIKPESRQLIMEGLHLATTGPGGTATSVFGEFPIEIAGKTGTAERACCAINMSWFISLAPYPNPNVVTVVTIEEGGFGAESAAPANKQILEAYFHDTLKKEAEAETKEAEKAYEGEAEYGEEVPAEETYEEVPGEEGLSEETPVEETPLEGEGGGVG
ncbi:MAG TPA: penicillin-binding protein 2 [Solirubrobacterales bacterium]|nr:penicillin-binding protein 2 [Solirubrobacterales bacterium]